jgi:hypothetical protein
MLCWIDVESDLEGLGEQEKVNTVRMRMQQWYFKEGYNLLVLV